MGLFAFLKLAVPVVVGLVSALFTRKPSQPVHIPQRVVVETGKSKEQLIEEARAKMGLDAKIHYNVGFVGHSGVGKSSLLNGFLGRPVAKVDIVECTAETSRYDVPDLPFLKIWDLPGGGTATHPAETYFMDKRIYAFDAICILYDDRLDEVALNVAKGCLEYEKPFVFLRTKTGEMVRAHQRDRQIADESEAIQDARRVILAQFDKREAHMPYRHVRHFFVDAYDMQDRVPLRFDEAAWIEWMHAECKRRDSPPAYSADGPRGDDQAK